MMYSSESVRKTGSAGDERKRMENDILSVIESGYNNVVSIPNGCSNTQWVAYNWDWLEQFDKIIFLTSIAHLIRFSGSEIFKDAEKCVEDLLDILNR